MSSAPWRNRIVGSAEVDPSDLLANPNNWRTHPGSQRDALRGSLDTVGWVQQVIVNTTTGHLVDGHARIEEAISRGVATVPVLYVELSPDEEKQVLATLDPIGAMAGADRELLAALLEDVKVDDEGLRKMLAELLPAEPQSGLTDPDDAPDLHESSIKQGDLFALGDHRLLCGDCTDPAMVGRLWGDAQADIIWTDPPYGVAYQSKLSVEDAVARRRRRDGLEVSGDDMAASGTRDLVVAALRLAPLVAGGAFYVASPSGDMESVFREALVEVGLQLRQQLVWMKDVFVMGRQDYHWRHESVLYGWREGAAHYWAGGRDQDTVWEIPRPKRSESHPTMKPVELVARSLANSSRKGDNVYDPFVGSGTTIIASEQLGRHCYAMEIDPRYAGVAIERWENFTGRKAEKLYVATTTRNGNSKMTDARVQVVLDALRGGNTRRASAAYAQVDHATFYRWLEDATFRDSVEKAEADAEARAVAIVIRAAQGGTWQAAAWWLERRKQDTYALHVKTEISGPDGGPIRTEEVLADHERDALRKAIDRELAKVPVE